jgi:hypothetical protein
MIDDLYHFNHSQMDESSSRKRVWSAKERDEVRIV